MTDAEQIAACLAILVAPGQVTELRALEGPTLTGYFDDTRAMVREATRLERDGRHTGIYLTLNPVHPDLLARAVNRVRVARRGEATSDPHITGRHWFAIDCDARRPKGISSTEPQHEAALEKGRAIRDWLKERGWPPPVEADSGNGAHLLYRVEEPNDGATATLFQQALQALSKRFDDAVVEVDRKTFNAARIWKLYGTTARKGDSTAERPHRRASILSAPSELALLPRSLLELLASEAKEAEKPAPSPVQAPNGKWPGVEAWCLTHGLALGEVKDWPERDGGTGRLWQIACPWNTEHDRGEAWVGEHSSGKPDAGCPHNGCDGRGWPELRDVYDPGWRERREERQRAWEARKRERPPHDDSEAPPWSGTEAPRHAETAAPSGFESAAMRLLGEREERAQLVTRIVPFGVSFLDDATGGILPRDLIVVGAATGAGKTALATIVAQQSAVARRHAYYFALEAEEREIERRLKYRELVALFYANERGRDGGGRLGYRDWYLGRLDDLLGRYDAVAEERLREKYRTLHTFYRGTSFTADDVERHFKAIEGKADLVILDHLHYVDVPDDEGENRGYKLVVKRLRDLSLCSGVPVILVAHLRKKQRGMPTLMPELDDFHGTSEITKMATLCVLLAPAKRPEGVAVVPWLWPTYLQLAKDRMEGATARYVARAWFNVRETGYEQNYDIGQVMGAKYELLEAAEQPQWYLNGRPLPKASRVPGEDDDRPAAAHWTETEGARA